MATLLNSTLWPPATNRLLPMFWQTLLYVGHPHVDLGPEWPPPPIPPFHFHSAWQHPAQPMWTNPERYRSSSNSSTAHLLLRPGSHRTGGHPQCSSGWPPRCTPSWNARPSYFGRGCRAKWRFDRKRLHLLARYHYCLSRAAHAYCDSNTRSSLTSSPPSTTQLWPNFPSPTRGHA